MDDPESLAGFLFLLLNVFVWFPVYVPLFSVNKLASSRLTRVILAVTPFLLLLLLWFFLKTNAARAVRESGAYVAVYLAIGAGWVGVGANLFSLMGISVRDDAIERSNPAALLSVIAAQAAVMFCFIGSNIGEGPGVHVVLLCAGVATGVWFLLWLVAEVFTHHRISERITIGRDLSTGLRLAGLLLANGFILGAAAAGNWEPERFVRDFVLAAWPALVFTLFATGTEYWFAEGSSPWQSAGVLLFYAAALAFYIPYRGYV